MTEFRPKRGEMDWSNEGLRAELSRLWLAGHSAPEIGRRLGCSKNAVVSATHRLDLPRRPSPIKQGGLQTREARKNGTAPTRSSLARGKPTLPAMLSVANPPARIVKVEIIVTDPMPGEMLTSKACDWPLWGDRDRPNHLYCGKPRSGTKRWCAGHSAIGFACVPAMGSRPGRDLR
jgi:hypothetical protein